MGELDDSVLLDVICSKSRHFALPPPPKKVQNEKTGLFSRFAPI